MGVRCRPHARPAHFQLRQTRQLRKSAEAEGKDAFRPENAFSASGVGGKRVFREDFVPDQGHLPLATDSRDGGELLPLEVGARWIIGAHHHDGSGSRPHLSFECGKIHRPSTVIDEGVRDEAERLEAGQVFEEWITGPGNQNVIAWFGQELEQPGVGLARAGREEDILGVYPQIPVGEDTRDRLPRGGQAAGGGFVDEGFGVGERRENLASRIREADPGRIGFGQIHDCSAVPPLPLQKQGKAVVGEVPSRARGEHGGGGPRSKKGPTGRRRPDTR